MIYIILAVVSGVVLFGAVCTCFKMGQKDGICKYGNDKETEEN